MRIVQNLRSSLLHSEIKEIIPLHLRLCPPAYFLAVAILMLLLATAGSAFAGSATWNLNPTDGNWNNPANWTPPTVPNGPTDTATFGVSNTTDVLLSANTEVNGVVFNGGASGFTITAGPSLTLTISGVGITNNSGISQNFVAAAAPDGATFPGEILFTNGATAGSLTAFTTNGAAVSSGFGGALVFEGDSTAGTGTFTNNGGEVSGAEGGTTLFSDTSSGGNSVLIANGGSGGGGGGSIQFFQHNQGHIQRDDVPARVEVFGNGNLDISRYARARRGVRVHALEGDGNVFLGGNALGVLDSLPSPHFFSGVIQDGGQGGGRGGSLLIDHGTLVLTNANTYTGGTTIGNGGTLTVNNKSGSGTGSGPVAVYFGFFRGSPKTKLGGDGTIAGPVTVGFTFNLGRLSPGMGGSGTLVIQNTLYFGPSATYDYSVNSRIRTADKVVANGVTIDSTAQFSFVGLGQVFTPGTVFTLIDNRAATPIAGNFSNLADGSIFTVNGYNFQVNYEGGDGNDLTLTVLP